MDRASIVASITKAVTGTFPDTKIGVTFGDVTIGDGIRWSLRQTVTPTERGDEASTEGAVAVDVSKFPAIPQYGDRIEIDGGVCWVRGTSQDPAKAFLIIEYSKTRPVLDDPGGW
jgi:hypothetical protein